MQSSYILKRLKVALYNQSEKVESLIKFIDHSNLTSSLISYGPQKKERKQLLKRCSNGTNSIKKLNCISGTSIPEIHWEGFPFVTRCYHNHEFDHGETQDYHFLLYNPASPQYLEHQLKEWSLASVQKKRTILIVHTQKGKQNKMLEDDKRVITQEYF